MIVFDSSTLILAAKVELLELFLSSLRIAAAIPQEVERECCSHKKSFDALLIARLIEEGRIRVVQVKNRRLVAKLGEDFGLGQGEAQAIALAVEIQAKLLGIDDKNGISACKILRIPFVNAIGILIRTHEKALVGTTQALMKLRALGEYGRYAKVILDDAERRLGERK